MILLDTSVLIAADIRRLSGDRIFGASILSRAELEFGVAVAGPGQVDGRRRRLADLDALFDWLSFTEATTHAYGILARVIHPEAPAQARRIDTYIAAHALQLSVPLMTANPKDFQRVAHLIDVMDFASASP